MTNEDKQLLLQDLCARLPYGVMVRGVFINYNKDLNRIQYEECDKHLECRHLNRYESLKPYLRPMSSMTKEEAEYLYQNFGWVVDGIDNPKIEAINYMYSHHLDYRELIPMGLALEAPKDMYKKD